MEKEETENKRDLKKLAIDLYHGKVFTDRHLAKEIEHGDMSIVSMVFMPLALMSREQSEFLKDAGLLYEYIDKAGPRAINGYPMFMSMQYLTVEDTRKMFAHYEQYVSAMKAFEENT